MSGDPLTGVSPLPPSARSGADGGGGGALHNLVASLSGINQLVSLPLFILETQRQALATNNLKDPPPSKKNEKQTEDAAQEN